ncbi:hypothetical protein [Flagellimonas meridianipacifica]|uniref:Lipoprotein n=1 Tax=Flagellimonas meridianipacifica TaxID=1080225 RepID=A0A2T0M6K3_9FLAO|nr:hypothetical protein [Allomuricauda pacifica]PRX53114.1 hypothetical protein CLV81_4015 [Allomuricauda pacifica]
MRNHPQLNLVILLLFLSSCSPKISTSLIQENKYNSLKYDEKITVLELNDKQPDNVEILGHVEIRDTGFSTKCNYNTALDRAKLEARTAGGNAIKITKHKKPDFWSTCHRIDATILKIKK